MPEYYGVPVAPQDKKAAAKPKKYTMTDDQKSRAKYVTERIALMDKEKNKYIESKRKALLAYDGGVSIQDDRNPIKVVAPFARIFVEAKTADQVKATTEPILVPVDDANDAWKAEIGSEALDHVRRVTHQKAKRTELIRMANIIGQSVEWKGYRSTTVKMRFNITNDDGTMRTVEKEVPGHGEIFCDIVDPLSEFWIDPEASGAHDALDCALFFSKNHEEFAEMFGDTNLYDIDGIQSGANGKVDGVMYFKKPSAAADMMVIYAWPSSGSSIRGMKPENVKEVFFGGLPDDHKMLPFVTHVNVPTFARQFMNDVVTRSTSGEAAFSDLSTASAKQKFWAYAGDPEIIMDLVELRTDFGRSLYRAVELAGKFMVATKGNFRIDNSIDWQHGDQIVGGAGQIEPLSFGSSNVGAFSSALDDLYSQMIQAVGTDPRNLTDSKQKTLGETIAQRESQFTRLEAIIDYDNEISGVRSTLIDYKLIQQWYTEPMLVALTGAETQEELEKFDETDGVHPKTGQPLIGKKIRTIRTNGKYNEVKKGKKTILRRDDSGKNSLAMRAEWIRTGEMDVVPMTKKRAGELQALKAQQIQDGINMYIQVLQLMQGQQPGTDPIVDQKDLPPLGDMLNEYWQMMGVAGKRKERGSTEKKIEEMKTVRKMANSQRKPFSEIVPVEQMTQQPAQ